MKAKSGFVLREVGDGTVLVPTGERVVDMNGMIVLNDTGKFIWERLDGSHTPAQIAQALVDVYDVSLEDATADVESFVAELGQLGILEDGPAAN
ncbi:MAG: PqqD family protein [Chthonomonadales bacterium]|nr:PqqD family protein [Chthonomonadales bacterium]